MTNKKRAAAKRGADSEPEGAEPEVIESEADSDDTEVSGMPPVPPPSSAPVLTDKEVSDKIPTFEPKPAWIANARALGEKTGDANAAWHDFFKCPLPTTAPTMEWNGPDARYSHYEGGRVLAAYHEGGFFAVLAVMPPAPARPSAPPRGR